MKRTFNAFQSSNNSNVKSNAVLEGIVVAMSSISDSQTDKNGRYWTALICDSNQNINRLTKYFSSKINCRLYEKLIESFKNKNGIKLNKLKLNGDNSYIATSETIAAPKTITFTPLCIQSSLLKDIQGMSNGDYVSFTCKVLDIGPDDKVIFNNGAKKAEKLTRTIIIADKTGSLSMNIWQNQFDLITEKKCYNIKLAKVKVFNGDVCLTSTVHTTFQLVDDIGDVDGLDSIPVSYDSTFIGNITSIGLVEEQLVCPKCYSTQIENNEKTIKCLQCQSRSIYVKEHINENKIKINIIDINRNTLELMADPAKIRALLEQAGHKQLSELDLVEQEDVLIALSSINIRIKFNPRNKHLLDIMINNLVSQLDIKSYK